MALYVRQGGAWTVPNAVYVRQGGAWVVPTAIYVRQGGAWVAASTDGTAGAPTSPPAQVAVAPSTKGRMISWVAGDASAESRVYRKTSLAGTWSLIGSAAVGALTFETTFTTGYFGVSHWKNGIETTVTSAVEA